MINEDDIKLDILEKSKYILFLSVDIVNSTEYKQKNADWQNIFDPFYENFNVKLNKSLDNSNILGNNIQIEDIPYLEFWKYLGDEVIYKVVIKQKIYIYHYLDSFKRAIQAFRKEEFSTLKLDLKATAWTAGFPLKNSVIKTKIPFSNHMLVDKNNKDIFIKDINDNLDYILEDYIGPSMDIGFRITKFSSKNKFIIGGSLAILLLEINNIDASSLDLYFDGKSSMKGVGYEYPIIWIDMKNHNDNDSQENKLIGRLKADRKDLLDFLYEVLPNKPYIFSKIDDITNKHLQKYINKFSIEKISDLDDSSKYDINTTSLIDDIDKNLKN